MLTREEYTEYHESESELKADYIEPAREKCECCGQWEEKQYMRLDTETEEVVCIDCLEEREHEREQKEKAALQSNLHPEFENIINSFILSQRKAV
jgi:hypothetical protein